MRDTRLVNKKVLDNPEEILEAGSSEEADIIAEWSREELVDSIQEWEAKAYKLEKHRDKLLLSNGELAIQAGNYRVQIGELKAQCDRFASILKELLKFFDKFGKGNITSLGIQRHLAEYEKLK